MITYKELESAVYTDIMQEVIPALIRKFGPRVPIKVLDDLQSVHNKGHLTSSDDLWDTAQRRSHIQSITTPEEYLAVVDSLLQILGSYIDPLGLLKELKESL